MKEKEQGITLIALVVTIILLLILAGVAINMALGDNGLFMKAKQSTEINKRASYLEELTLIADHLQIDKASQDLTNKEYIDKFEEKVEEKLKEGGILEGSSTIRKDDETLRVITLEGYVYDVVPEKIDYKGKQGQSENQPPEIKQGDIIFTPSHTTPINGDVTVEITTNIDIEGYYLQWSRNNTSWTTYTGPVPLTENGKIYARVANILDEAKGFAETEITIIDKEYPEIISLTADASNDTLTGRAKDEGTGINAYAFSKTENLEENLESTEWKPVNPAVTEEADYTFKAKSTGTYYFYVKDEANNVTKQSVPIEVIPKAIYLGRGSSIDVTEKCAEYGIDPTTLTTDNFLVQPVSHSASGGNSNTFCCGLNAGDIHYTLALNPTYSGTTYTHGYYNYADATGGTVKATGTNKGSFTFNNIPADMYLLPNGKAATGIYDMGISNSVDVNSICNELGIDTQTISINNFIVFPVTAYGDKHVNVQDMLAKPYFRMSLTFNNVTYSTGKFTYSLSMSSSALASNGTYPTASSNHSYRVYFIPDGIVKE